MRPGPGRTWSSCRNCSPHRISAAPRTTPPSIWPNPSPDRPPTPWLRSPRPPAPWSWRRLFERRGPGVFHNSWPYSARTAPSSAATARCTSPQRSGLRGKILLHLRGPGLYGRCYPVRLRGHAHLLGPVVSRGRPGHDPARRHGARLSHGHRLASVRKGRLRRAPARELDDRAARPCHCQRRLRGRRQPGGRRRFRPRLRGDPGIWGSSFLADPSGQILAQAGIDTEEIVTGVIGSDCPGNHPPPLAVVCATSRVDAYGGLARLYGD